MTYDPNRMHDYSDRVVGYGADDRSFGFYAVFSKATTGQATTERSEGPPMSAARAPSTPTIRARPISDQIKDRGQRDQHTH